MAMASVVVVQACALLGLFAALAFLQDALYLRRQGAFVLPLCGVYGDADGVALGRRSGRWA